jgi:osmoprotectant transport system ATP-binding protein
VLVGPSGSGKTTAMRLINRMISISDGDILLGGRSVLEREARELRREIGYVIQQIGLFPHQTVGENIATVPGLLGWDKQRIAARVQELLALIGLDPEEMAGRYPSQLSGGQRQRVGVARALAADPPLMLMDEPFGAIDPINRARLQDEFLGLQEKVKKTVVFVTHDIDEAIKMGDRIAILREGGVLAQYDTPREILINPADEFVAQFVGADRGIKRLSLTTLQELKLIEPNGLQPGRQHVGPETSVRDALSLILTAGGEPLAVIDGDGQLRGLLTLGLIEQLLTDEAAGNGNGNGDRGGVVR